MAHSHGAGTKVPEDVGGENLVHQAHILVVVEETVVPHHDAAALLPPVLEGKETIIDRRGDGTAGLAEHTKDATFFMERSHEQTLLSDETISYETRIKQS
jgi:hypothetical protein